MKRFVITALLALGFQASAADGADRAIACDGCTRSGMSSAATRATNSGTVYVFNAQAASVRKYTVYTEIIDTQPYTVWKQAMEQPVEEELAHAYSELQASLADISTGGSYRLPPDFPIRSVAGALVDPAYSTTSIEDWLRQLNLYRQAEIHASTVLARLIRSGINLFDANAIIDVLIIRIEFPDGSTQDYRLEYAVNAVTLEPQAEVVPVGNARTSNGLPAPTSRLAFDGHRFVDHDGSLREWIEWARMNGVTISGSSSGTVMVCTIDGSEIRCTVRKSP